METKQIPNRQRPIVIILSGILLMAALFAALSAASGPAAPLGNSHLVLAASVPPAPATLVSVRSYTGSNLTWTYSAGKGVGIVNTTVLVYAGAACTGVVTYIPSIAPATTAVVAGLAPGVTTCYAVMVWNATGHSPLKFANDSVPAAPTAVTETASTSSSITLTWVQSVTSSITNNEVLLFSGGACSVLSAGIFLGSAGTTYTATGLVAATTYGVQVTALTAAGGEGPGSTCLGATTAASNGGGGCPPTCGPGSVVSNNTTAPLPVPYPLGTLSLSLPTFGTGTGATGTTGFLIQNIIGVIALIGGGLSLYMRQVWLGALLLALGIVFLFVVF